MPEAVTNLVASDLKAGVTPVLLQLSDQRIKVSPLICFEDSLGDLTRRTCLAGAQLLVNLTNDGWFRHSAGAEQHLANAIFRAVENRRPLVRCSNTGVTGLVTVSGLETHWAPLFEEAVGSGIADVPTTHSLTFYTRHGDWLAHLSALISLLWVAFIVRKRCSEKLPQLAAQEDAKKESAHSN
jgi:apolipoprotein N-acyltransferase